MTTLAHERQFATMRAPHDRRRRRSGAPPRRRAEADEYFKTYAWYPQRAGRADLVPQVAELAGPHATTRSSARRSPASSPCGGPTSGRPAGPRPRGPPAGRRARRGRSASWPPADVAQASARDPLAARRRRRPCSPAADSPARRRRRRGPALGAGAVDRRRHRRDPAQHHRRAGPRPAPRAVGRPRHPVPRDPAVRIPVGRGRVEIEVAGRGATCR